MIMNDKPRIFIIIIVKICETMYNFIRKEGSKYVWF